MTALALVAVLAAFGPEPLLPGAPHVLKGHTDSVVAIAFSPDGKRFASASRDKTVRIWSLETGETVSTLRGAEAQLSCLGFSGDGQRLAIGDVGLHARVVEVATGKVLREIAHPDGAGEVALNADGTLLALAGLTDTSAVYDVGSGKKKFDFRGRTARFTADGKSLIVAVTAGALGWLDAKTGKVRRSVSTVPDAPVATATPSGAVVVSWVPSGLDVKVWSDAGKLVTTLKGPVAEMDRRKARLMGVAVTPDGKRIATGAGDGLVRLWNVADGSVLATWPADKNSAVAISADGAWVAVADSAFVKLWKLP